MMTENLKPTINVLNAFKIFQQYFNENFNDLICNFAKQIIVNTSDNYRLNKNKTNKGIDIEIIMIRNFKTLKVSFFETQTFEDIIYTIYVSLDNEAEEDNLKKCHITKIGIYMKDTYDFNGNQYLGHWNYFGLFLDLVSGGMNIANTERKSDVIDPIIGESRSFGNEDFREFRKHTGKGCDLYLFSDIIEVDVNIEFIF